MELGDDVKLMLELNVDRIRASFRAMLLERSRELDQLVEQRVAAVLDPKHIAIELEKQVRGICEEEMQRILQQVVHSVLWSPQVMSELHSKISDAVVQAIRK